MSRTERVELTVLCLVENGDKILLLNRKDSSWSGYTLPGGHVEPGEPVIDAVIREMKEETGLEIEIERMLWHVEQIKDNGEQRFVDFFLGKVTGGTLGLGSDPEFSEEDQVMTELRYMTIEEMAGMDNVYPEFLADELKRLRVPGSTIKDPYRVRVDAGPASVKVK